MERETSMPTFSSPPGLITSNATRRRGRKQKLGRSPTCRIHPPAREKPIDWPPELKGHKTPRRKIAYDPSALGEPHGFFRLPYDIRHTIYSVILKSAGTQQRISCPSVSRRKLPSELQRRYLQCQKHAPADVEGDAVCGHYECDDPNRVFFPPLRRTSSFTLADLASFMRTSKFAYQEIAHFLYRSITFTFASFPELGAFLDWISPEVVPSIRSIHLIAHLIPDSTEHCTHLIQGHYFRGADWDHVALLRRMPGLGRLEIDFYPSLVLCFTLRFREMMEPLRELAELTVICVRLPRIFYDKVKKGKGLPLVQEGRDRTAFYSLTRLEARGVGSCKAYYAGSLLKRVWS